MRKFKKSNKKDEKVMYEVTKKRLKLLPLYNDKYRQRYYEDIAKR